MLVTKQQDIASKIPYKNNINCQTKNNYLKNLKAHIAALDGQVSRQSMPLGIESLDSALAGGLALGRVHMLCGMMQAHAAVSGFVSCMLMRLLAHLSINGKAADKAAGPIVWCPASGHGGAGMLYGHGLAALGLDPARLLIVDTPNPARRMAALDDIVRTNGLTAVIAEYDGMQKSSDYWMRLMRRTQLAAEASQTTVFLLGAPIAASGCETMWHVAPAGLVDNAVGDAAISAPQSWRPAWELTLQRACGGYRFHGYAGWDAAAGQFVELAGLVPAQTSELPLYDAPIHHLPVPHLPVPHLPVPQPAASCMPHHVATSQHEMWA
jgi:protein ImuA